MACSEYVRRWSVVDGSLTFNHDMANVAIKLTPGASADRIDGWDVDVGGRPVLKVRVRVRPVEGEANAALLKLMAKALGIPKSAVTLERGGQSRQKRIGVDGLSEEEVCQRLSVAR